MANLLPAEITLDIFSRLPDESILQCKQVCKTWRTLVNDPCFFDRHVHRSRQLEKMGILYLHGEYEGYQKQLYYGEHDENGEESHGRLKRINHPPVKMGDNLVGSCNGLICFSVSSGHDFTDSIYICNPITREYVNLPRYNNYAKLKRYLTQPMAHGFGYLPSTNEYKVVIIFFHYNLNQPNLPDWVRSVQVYTLGSSGWRNKEEIMFSPSGDCVYVNGALYWLNDENQEIVTFDLADEQFHVLPSPPFVVSAEDKIFLRVLGEFLCVVHRRRDESLDVWSFKKMHSSTPDMKDQEHQFGWDMEFSVLYRIHLINNYDPFAFTKSGEFLLWYDHSHHYPDNLKHFSLFSYDPKTERLVQFDTDFLFLEAIPHMNSFVSLKALGEDVKILGSSEESLKRMRGRPKICRRGDEQDEDEAYGGSKKSKSCTACGNTGHNRRTCSMV